MQFDDFPGDTAAWDNGPFQMKVFRKGPCVPALQSSYTTHGSEQIGHYGPVTQSESDMIESFISPAE